MMGPRKPRNAVDPVPHHHPTPHDGFVS